MTIQDLLAVAPTVVLWVVVVWRVRSLRGSAPERDLWGTLLALAVAQTLQLAAVTSAIDESVGTPGISAVLRQSVALLAAGGVLLLIRGLAGDTSPDPGLRRRLEVVGGLALVAMLASAVIARNTDIDGALTQRSTFTGTSWPWLVYWAAYLGYLGWAMVDTTTFNLSTSRRSAPGPMRTGLRLMASGAALGIAYVALKATAVTGWAIAAPRGLVEAAQAAGTPVLGLALVLIAVGTAYPRVVLAARAHLSTRRSLRTLRPLWRAVTELVPHVALHAPADRDPVLQRPAAARATLYRRVVEIRDGLLTLKPYARASARTDAARAAAATGLDEVAARAVGEAVWFELARRAFLRGGPAATITPDDDTLFGGSDQDAEVHWLSRVAAEHTTSPLVPRLADELDTRPTETARTR